jgi:hypothetical protein
VPRQQLPPHPPTRSVRASPDSKLKARLAELGSTVLPSSSANFGKLIAEETEKWAKVVKFSGAKPN